MTREKLLLIPNWTCKDVCFYSNSKKTKAYEIMKLAREKYNGGVSFNSQCVSRDSVLLVLGTSIEREIYILKQLKERRTNEETLHSRALPQR